MSEDERAIRQVVETWMRATKGGDLSTVLELMTDDVVFMVPGQEPFGKEAFAASAKSRDGMEITGESDIQELQLIDGWAYLRSHIRLTVRPAASGEPVRRSGYTLSIFRKGKDGRWRLARDANLLT
jgi:uncharacterized protein (TIGR02246 family)